MRTNWNSAKVARVMSATFLLAVIGCASTRYDRTAGEFFDDRMLVSRVKDALDEQPVYKYPDVKVNTYRGVVQLSGFVATAQQREAATEIARRVRGVAQIENDIMVAPLDRTAVRDYIPGRDEGNHTNDTDRATGAAPANSNASRGSAANSPR